MIDSPDKSREAAVEAATQQEQVTEVATEKPAITQLVELIGITNSIPSFKDIEAADFNIDIIEDAEEKLRILLQYVSKGGEGASLVDKRMQHDLRNSFIPVLGGIGLVKAGINTERTKFLSYIDSLKNRIIRVIRTNIALLRDKPNLEEAGLLEPVKNGAQDAINSNTGVQYVINEKGEIKENGTITLDIPRSLKGWIDASSISIAIYNLVSNSIKAANKTLVAINIRVRELNSGCIQITVEDSGEGFNFPKIKKELAQHIAQKEQRGLTISDIERKIIQHQATTADLTNQLFEVGVSASGSTGIGLSTVKAIVFNMHGEIQMGNNPDGGAYTKITIPNTKETDPVARHRIMENHKAMNVL